jgi:hypothetical protein
MSRKLTRYLDEIEKTEKKMAEMKAHLEALRQSQKEDEDAEIVKSIRSMNVKGWDLVKLLDGIQKGTITITQMEATKEETEKKKKGEDVPVEDEGLITDDYGMPEASESEDME